MKIVFVGNYPPRVCGIATFTQHLAKALIQAGKDEFEPIDLSIIAMNDGKTYEYPSEVVSTIRQQNLADYHLAAKLVNQADADAVIIQHEFGIFGGEAGSHILQFAEWLEVPCIVTLHTVLRQPNEQQRMIVERLGRLANRLVVMSKLAVKMLRQVYHVPKTQIARIAHGSPVFDESRREPARRELGFDGRHVVLTFGLLGRGKGIETAIEALPEVKAANPNLLYVLLGKTHPGVIEHEGEAYRESLWERVEQLGLADCVRFDNMYVDEPTLCDYLLAADSYILPYPNEAQITSGTLSYAVGAGCAVLSTPFWHAKELLAGGRGELFGFGDSRELSNKMIRLLGDTAAHTKLRNRARAIGRRLSWPRQGAEYLELLRRVTSEQTLSLGAEQHATELIKPDLQHIKRLTDSTGMLQHATLHLPNRKEGYCLDDNVRALILVVQALEAGHTQRHTLEGLLDTYLTFVLHAQQLDGRFHNFVGYNREFLDKTGSDDSFGRTIWALGTLLNSKSISNDHKDLAWHIYLGARPNIDKLRSLRAVAFVMLGLEQLNESDLCAENTSVLIDKIGSFLLTEFNSASNGDWTWFESVVSYDNAILPLACIAAANVTEKPEYLAVAYTSTKFLERYTFAETHFRPIGCHSLMRRGTEPSRYDQQPLDTMSAVYLYRAWYEREGEADLLEKAALCFSWFTGNNDLGLPLYHAERGSCFDGLMERGLNRNQGAESTLAFWLARNHLAEAYINSKSAIPAPTEAYVRTLEQDANQATNSFQSRLRKSASH